jgi:WD40 repeat protein
METSDRTLKRSQQWNSSDILLAIAAREDVSAAQDTSANAEQDTSDNQDASAEQDSSDAAPAMQLFLGSTDFSVFEFVRSGDSPQRLEFTGDRHTSYVTSVARCGGQLISGSYDGRLIWWNLDGRKAIRGVTAHDRWIRRVVATPDGRHIVSVADDMLCKVWDAETGELQFTLSGHAEETPHHYPSMLYAVAISEDGQWMATADKVGHVVIWDLAQGTSVVSWEAPEFYTWDPRQRIHSIGGIRSLVFSPCGEKLALGGIGQIGNIDHLGGPARIEVFRWRDAEHLLTREDEKHKGLVEQMAWHPSGTRLLCAGGDDKGFISIWDLESGEIVEQQGSDGHIHGFAMDAGWTLLYTAAHRRIEQWELPNLDNRSPSNSDQDA